MNEHPTRVPTKIILHKISRTLEIQFPNNETFILPCAYLRAFSMSADMRDHSASAGTRAHSKPTDMGDNSAPVDMHDHSTFVDMRDNSAFVDKHDYSTSADMGENSTSVNQRYKTRAPTHPNVNILAIEQVGHYAIKPIFSDGHRTGIYSWNTLYELGKNKELNWPEK